MVRIDTSGATLTEPVAVVEILKAVVFGIVEGVTEWLPVSSTGHMILLQEVLPMNLSPAFWGMFLVVIQLGAIMAVVLLYWKTLWPITASNGKLELDRTGLTLWLKIVVASIPAGTIGLAFSDLIEARFYNWLVVAAALIIFGIAFIVVERKHAQIEAPVQSLAELSYGKAFAIGWFQLLAAVFPGTSRSGATILGGLSVGVQRSVAAEFTFLLAVPAMLGASIFKLTDFGLVFTPTELWALIVGTAVAFLVSIAAIKFLLGYIKLHDFQVFGWYRIVLGVIVILFFSL